MKLLKNTMYVICLLAAVAVGCMAQNKAPQAATVPVATPAPESVATVAPVALKAEQIKQLQEANKTLELAKARAEKAQAEYEAVQARIEAIIASYRFELNVTADRFAPQLQVIDQQAGTVGFLPLPQPAQKKENSVK